MEPKYYPINEQMARTAHEMMSFRDYPEGHLTKEYQGYVDEAYQLADEAVKTRPEEAGRIYGIADRYARKLADNLNAKSRIGAMCPSVMISGAGNFPVAKKRKQNAAADRNFEEFREIQKLLDKIRSIERGKDIIKSGDADAVEKLERKVAALRERQEFMKKVNAWYKKNGTLDGCPEMTEEQIAEMKAAMQTGFHFEDRPFQRYEISNNGQNLRKAEERLKDLKAAKEKENTEEETEFFQVVENTEIMRLQLIFDDKPEPEVREILKRNGFRWSPKNEAWQRQLTPNAKYALGNVIKALKALEGNGE